MFNQMKRFVMMAGLMGSLLTLGCGTELPVEGDTQETLSEEAVSQPMASLVCTRTTTQAPCGTGYTRTTDTMYCPDINFIHTETICVKCSAGCSVASVTENISGCQHTYGACK
jgi:hypothetical protein